MTIIQKELFEQPVLLESKKNISVFFNTTKEKEPELTECKKTAETQNSIIEMYFKTVGGKTACECHADLIRAGLMNERTPLTSVRRSITVLCDAGVLKNTFEKRIGIYGRNNYVWQSI